ncbi:MAG: hypothetical protein K5649_07465 [Lachnospiraceae bacterium]|nr:hypothetical protein [Lachnospiraceae bacterium]
MNTRKIPAIIMLLAGSIACVMTYLNHYDLKDMLIVLILVLIIFLFIGLVVKGIFDSIHLPSADAVNPDGEVIEKSDEEGSESEEGAGEGEASADAETEQTEEEPQA